MGVPTSEVGYTITTTRRETTKEEEEEEEEEVNSTIETLKNTVPWDDPVVW